MPANRNDLMWNATVKASPAIADFQAPESFVRVFKAQINVGAPNYNHDIYTVPAGKIYVMEIVQGVALSADPTYIEFVLFDGVTNYAYYLAPYVVIYEKHTWATPIKYDEGEIVRITWSGTLAGTDVKGLTFGYLIDKY